MNVAHLLEWSARRHFGQTALVFEGRTISYGEVDERASRLAAGLRELGVAAGDRVAVFVENRPEYLEAEFAIAKAGAVRVPILVSLTAQELARALAHTTTSTVIASARTRATLRDAAPMLDDELTVVAIGEGAPGDVDYEAVIAGSEPRSWAADQTDDDLYAIRVTGGTTGSPKAVAMTQRCMVNVINNMLLNWPMRGDDVVLSVHPLSHASGMVSYPYWMRGARNVIHPAFGFEPEVFLAAVQEHRVSAVFIVPTVLNRLLDSPALDECDHSSLRTVIYGGAPIPQERLRQALERFGPVFIQVYGTTEAPMMLTTLLPDEHVAADEATASRLGSAGREALNVEVRVVRGDGTPAPVGEVGEIASRGPHNMAGYWRNDELTAERMRDGWVHTGDMGRFDEAGYLYIVDRKEDLIITGGFNVWPAEIEDVIYTHPEVREAAVFGVEHDRWGETVAAVVVPRPGADVQPRTLTEFLRERLTPYKVPKCIVVRHEPLPQSAVGKHLHRRVRDEHADEIATLLS